VLSPQATLHISHFSYMKCTYEQGKTRVWLLLVLVAAARDAGVGASGCGWS